MPDRSKITMKSENEIKYWIKHFGVTTKNWNTLLSESAIPQQASGKSYEIVSLTFNENSGPPAAISYRMFRNEIKNFLQGTRLSICCGTPKEVKHALNYTHGNRCRGFDRHDITGSSRQRRTHLSTSLRRRLLPNPLHRQG